MDGRLYRAAVKGDVPSLLQLLHEDELMLERALVGPSSETPLHIAAMLGRTEFVAEILFLKPELASELDSERSTPLHLAAAKGYVDVVKSLLEVYPDACLVADKYGRNPLQVAACKGKVEVVEVLVWFKPEAGRSCNRDGETVLHMCVRSGKLESLKVVVGMFGGEDELIDWRDREGNSALHLAAANGQYETLDFLTTHTNAQMNSPNLKGFTAADLLAQSRSGFKENAIGDYAEMNGTPTPTPTPVNRDSPRRGRGSSSRPGNKRASTAYDWKKHFKRQNSWLERMRNSLMVVATLTATMAFQAGINPPAGVWQDSSSGGNSTSLSTNNGLSIFGIEMKENTNVSHIAGVSIMADKFYSLYIIFISCNTIGLIASLSIILLLISGLPMRRRLFVGFLMAVMWVVITSMAFTYVISVAYMTPRDQVLPYEIILIGIVVWAGMMMLLIIMHIIRLIVRAFRICLRAVIPRRRRAVMV
ncbi:hypothetical protein SAY86_026717 [Trapa natans]|uniref:PGG domain-containing protein n=1 Tax=Trapa natans TaxID=22666 RepID=A0AAN7KG80_TRANT|nr:hypothetical protein SAY86_026717 [Trapa natans]